MKFRTPIFFCLFACNCLAQYQFEASFVINDSSGYAFGLYNTTHFELTRKERKKYADKEADVIGRIVGTTIQQIYSQEVRSAFQRINSMSVSKTQLNQIRDVAMENAKKAAKKYGIKILHDPLDNLDIIGYPEVDDNYWKYTNTLLGYSIVLPRKFIKRETYGDSFRDTTENSCDIKLWFLHRRKVKSSQEVYSMDAVSFTSKDSMVFSGQKIFEKDTVYTRQIHRPNGMGTYREERYYFISRGSPLVLRLYYNIDDSYSRNELNEIIKSLTVFKKGINTQD